MNTKTYSLTEARTKLTRIVRDAQAGETSVITRRGIPVAKVVPMEQWQTQKHRAPPNSGILALRGTGRGLWSTDPENTVTSLRDEWTTKAPTTIHG